MITIKTQEIDGVKFVITKTVSGQTRVSCSCCEAECCMYSAQGLLDGLYGEADLPDTLEILPYDDNREEVVIATKTGQTYGPVNFEFSNQYQQKIEFVEDYESLGPYWTLQVKSTNVAPWVILDIAPCLFILNESDLAIRDTFEDTYTVEFDGVSFSIFRTSVCRWENIDVVIGGRLCYAILTFEDYGINGTPENPNAETFGWYLTYGYVGIPPNQEDLITDGLKDGLMNTPVGTYAGEVPATISE